MRNTADHDDEEMPKGQKKSSLTAKQTYNAVTDTVTGANVRWRDNLFQGLGIAVFVLLGAGIGALVASEWLVGVLVGLLLGLIGGVIVTGSILMIYRAVQHARGEHD